MARRMYDENQIKSIASEAGGGKIYRHILNITNNANNTNSINLNMEIISSKDLNIDSLTDLKTILGSTFKFPVSGYVKRSTETIYSSAAYISQAQIYYVDNATGYYNTPLTNVTYTDTITEI